MMDNLSDEQIRDYANNAADKAYEELVKLSNYVELKHEQGLYSDIAQHVGEVSGRIKAEVATTVVTAGTGKALEKGTKVVSSVAKIASKADDIIPDTTPSPNKGKIASKDTNLGKPNTNSNNTVRASDTPNLTPIECSFHPDMQVRTRTGFMPIASIQIGDWVFAKNEITGKKNYRQVLRTINSTDPDTTHITIVNSYGKAQTIISDGLHPYFVDFTGDLTPPTPSLGHKYYGKRPNSYWVAAKDIETGHRFLDEHGNYQTVISVITEQIPLDSYNLEVDTDHTFFIKGIDGDEAVWVHNKNCFIAIGNNPEVKTIDGKQVTFADYQVDTDINGNPIFEKKATIDNPDLVTNPNAPKFVEVKISGIKNPKVEIIDSKKPDVTLNADGSKTLTPGKKRASWNPEGKKPQPNQAYLTPDGYKYQTDALARVSYVEADLKLDSSWATTHRNLDQQRKAGGADRLPDDDGGHLIASVFKGMGEQINVVPMNSVLNRKNGAWYEMEEKWRKNLEAGKSVQVKIEPVYIGNSKRPERFIITEKINNGEDDIITLENTSTGK